MCDVIKRMSKEEFINNLTIIKEDIDFYDELYKLTREYNRDDAVDILPKSISIAIRALEAAIGDKYEYVSWWCFEKDWGERGKDFCVTIDDKVIPTETMSDIYDLVTINVKEDMNTYLTKNDEV